MLKIKKERKEEDEDKEEKKVVVGLLLDKIYLLDPTVVFLEKRSNG